jgi:oxygen-dependent protoporphyrinogen oxidase
VKEFEDRSVEDCVEVVIVGGGISGLAAAWFIDRAGHSVRVLEASDRVGGVIASDRIDGFLLERGPNSTLQRSGADGAPLGRVIAETGLSARAIGASPAGQRRYILRDGHLHALPGSPIAFARSRLFSWPAKLRLLAEPFIGRADGEETIARFAERRLGREFLDYAVGPFVAGIYAGDAERLSVRAAVPRVYALEHNHGSLVRGAIAGRKLGKGAGGPPGHLISFDEGMEVLPRTLAAELPRDAVHTGRRVVSLAPRDGKWEIRWRQGGAISTERAGQVILALPAGATAELVEPFAPEAASLLREITYAPIVTVGLGYRREQIRHPVDGFGYLAARRPDPGVLGALFSSALFPRRAPDGRVMITAFIGGVNAPEILDHDDEAVIARVHDEVAAALHIEGAPQVVGLTRYRAAVAQYALGHLDRIARIDALVDAFPGLHLRASWRDGVSVADCVTAGEKLSRHIVSSSE